MLVRTAPAAITDNPVRDADCRTHPQYQYRPLCGIAAQAKRLAMISIRHGDERGRAKLAWLDSRHSFSFGDYHDPEHMGFGPLRVINEDRVQPGAGFPTHGHRDMEIISYVLEGALEHKDSLGTGSVIRPGDVQRMSAGSGIRHSEFNPSRSDAVHFLQIWLLPDTEGLAPSYEQKSFGDREKRGHLRLVAAHDGRDGSVLIHQDVDIYASLLDRGETVAHTLPAGRKAWVQMARGEAEIDGRRLQPGDGAAIEQESAIRIAATTDGAEFLLFDLP
jgi:redox-sensitive bicupin YhaK (pirin superfamily)